MRKVKGMWCQIAISDASASPAQGSKSHGSARPNVPSERDRRPTSGSIMKRHITIPLLSVMA